MSKVKIIEKDNKKYIDGEEVLIEYDMSKLTNKMIKQNLLSSKFLEKVYA